MQSDRKRLMKWAYVSCWRDRSGFYRIEKHLHEENNLLRAGVRIEEIRYLTFFGNRRFSESTADGWAVLGRKFRFLVSGWAVHSWMAMKATWMLARRCSNPLSPKASTIGISSVLVGVNNAWRRKV
jgi:hypothetical protein